MAIDIIARGMIEDSNDNVSQLSEKVYNHTGDSDIHVTITDKDNWNGYANEIETNKTDISQLFDITKGGAIVNNESSYSIDNAVDYPLLGLSLYGKSAQDGTPTPDNPVDIVSVGDSGSVEVVACGENILRPNVIANAYYNDNGDIIISSTFAMYDFVRIDGKKVTLSATKIKDGEGLRYALFDENKNFISRSLIMNAEKVVINSPNAVYIRVFISIICYKDCYLAFGENGTTEHYKGNTASIETALPLCGIPVSEGGNYTDNNGQQWICDTLVYNADGTGKIIKHTAKIDSYNGEAITTPYMSTTGGLDTGATVIYQIDTPQEIALTAAEMTELMQMQTFDGVTNISNDSGADMDVKYCTDKALSEYVMPVITNMQAQIDELKSAVLSLGSNV